MTGEGHKTSEEEIQKAEAKNIDELDEEFFRPGAFKKINESDPQQVEAFQAKKRAYRRIYEILSFRNSELEELIDPENYFESRVDFVRRMAGVINRKIRDTINKFPVYDDVSENWTDPSGLKGYNSVGMIMGHLRDLIDGSEVISGSLPGGPSGKGENLTSDLALGNYNAAIEGFKEALLDDPNSPFVDWHGRTDWDEDYRNWCSQMGGKIEKLLEKLQALPYLSEDEKSV